MTTFALVWLSLALTVGYYQNEWARTVGLATTTLRLSTIAQNPTNNISAWSPTVGEGIEPCDTQQTMPEAIVLSTEDPWQAALTDSTQPGAAFLLHGGLYQATDKLWLKAGTPDAPVVIKPYNCEAVTIQGSIRPNSYTTIAGITIKALGIDDLKWAIRFDGKNGGAITNTTLRNNTILGGTVDAIRLSDDVHQIRIEGNRIDGGESGHDIFVTAETIGLQPSAITITQNRLTKEYFNQASEDMIQLRDTGTVTITGNTCTDGLNMEQCIDIKSTTAPLWIAYNIFDGDNLHLLGKGEDLSGGCMVIHESDGHPEQHIIEHNIFRHCKGTSIRFASGLRDEQSSALLRYNLFLQSTITDGTILVEEATDLHFISNSVILGELKLGNSSQTRLPQNTVVQNNIFYQTAIDDNLLPSAAAYECAYNLLYQLAGDGFSTVPCSHTVDANPQFLDLVTLDFYLQPGSPALGSGENGSDMGALPMKYPAEGLIYSVYLPFVLP